MSSDTSYWSRRLPRRTFVGGTMAVSAVAVGLGSIGCSSSNNTVNNGSAKPVTQASAGAASGTGVAGTAGSATRAASGRVANMIAANGGDIGNLDPHSVAGTGGGNKPSYDNLFNQPITIDYGTSKPQAFLATSAEFSPDGLSLVYKVRPGVKFHNGATLDAESFAFSYERMSGINYANKDYKSSYGAYFLSKLDKIEATDTMTVKLTFKKPDSSFLYHEAVESFIVPKQYLIDKGDDGFARAPVGTGPFQFVSRSPGESLVVKRFPDYWNTDLKLGPIRSTGIDTLTQRILPEDATRVASLQTGEVDLITNVPYPLLKTLQGAKGISIRSVSTTQPMMLMLNTLVDKDPTTGGTNPFKDKRVRQAMNYAVDIGSIVKNILTGQEPKSYGSSRISLGYPTDAEIQPYQYDAAKASQLLSAAGYANGFETTLYGAIGRWPSTPETLQAISGQLARVGVKANVKLLEYAPFIQGAKDKSLAPMYYIGQSTGPDPRSNFDTGYRSSSPYSTHDPYPEIDALIDKSEATFDYNEIAKLNKQIMINFYQEAPWVFLWELLSVTAWRSDKWTWPEPIAPNAGLPRFSEVSPV